VVDGVVNPMAAHSQRAGSQSTSKTGRAKFYATDVFSEA